ncbi:MAG: nitroreductase [Pseudomonadota bacterium]
MDKLDILQQRVSVSKLLEPAPDDLVLHEVFKAAARAADHGMLQPRRFLLISGAGLQQLSEIFVNAATKSDPEVSPAVLEKCRNMPKRAPLIIVAIAVCHLDSKVPRQEQIIACGASVQNILNALFALGFGAIWRTGEMAYDAYVKNELGLAEGEEIVGFVYVGTPAAQLPKPRDVDVSKLYKTWLVE